MSPDEHEAYRDAIRAAVDKLLELADEADRDLDDESADALRYGADIVGQLAHGEDS